MTPLTEEQSTFTMKIPKQLPDSVDEEALMASAQSIQSTLESVVIVLVIVMAMLNVDPSALINGYFAVQMGCFLTIYNLSLPANALIYLNSMRKIVQFEIIHLDTIMLFFGIEAKLSDYMDETVTPFVSNEELGIKTTNYWINASTFLYVIVLLSLYWFVLRLIGM